MPQYTPPLRDFQFVLHEVLDAQGHCPACPPHAEVNRELIDQVLEEGGKFCAEVLFPLNRSGDEEGCRYVGDGVVATPAGLQGGLGAVQAGRLADAHLRHRASAGRACPTRSASRSRRC